MPPRRRKTPPKPPVAPALPGPRGLLDWGTSAHWSESKRPCRHCGANTNMRDDQQRPACKVCAEAALAEVAEIVRTHAQQEL